MFMGRTVSHILPYNSPVREEGIPPNFVANMGRISISGVQEKFSLFLDKNKLRLTEEDEQGTYILKPIPNFGKNRSEIPANEHLTMQLAEQVFSIETAKNGLIFFQGGEPAYLTKRFDVKPDSSKWGQEDFASLAEKTPQTHGAHYKYLGNYSELFEILKKYVPAYRIEATRLLRLIIFNYLFSNGDAHLKNFSLLETSMGDYRLSPAYDLLNTRLHVEDTDFALEEGLLPSALAKGKMRKQFLVLSDRAEIPKHQGEKMLSMMSLQSDKVISLIGRSFLSDKAKRAYLQMYQRKLKKLS